MVKKEIAVIPTGEKNAIKVTLVERDEKFFVDVRHMFKNELGVWIHTKKGLHMTPEVTAGVKLAMEGALKETT